VAFSNHTGHPQWRGKPVPAAEIRELFEGIAELGVLPRCDAVLSGYLGAAETGAALIDIVGRVKAANPRALFCCDPVMGDDGPGWYISPAVREFYRDRALAAADIATPNRFELEWLSGRPVTDLAAAAEAAAELRRRGPQIVLVTSLEPAAGEVAMLASAPEGAWVARTPRLDLEATGCGDAVAALFLARLLRGETVPAALALTAAAIHAVIEATAPEGELALVAAQEELVAPSRKVPVSRL
jgi:pyridoxine kinase